MGLRNNTELEQNYDCARTATQGGGLGYPFGASCDSEENFGPFSAGLGLSDHPRAILGQSGKNRFWTSETPVTSTFGIHICKKKGYQINPCRRRNALAGSHTTQKRTN